MSIALSRFESATLFTLGCLAKTCL